MIDESKRSQRGHRLSTKLPPETKRSHCVSVRLNKAELDRLDNQRQRVNMKRGEYLRASSLHVLPSIIPEINRQAWLDLGRSLGNLATVSSAMRGGDYVLLNEVERTVRELRQQLIGIRYEAESD